MTSPVRTPHQERISAAMKVHWKKRKAREESIMAREPYFYAVGSWVEDRRDHRPDVCFVFWGEENTGYTETGERVERSYSEACELARKIAALLNEHYPNANNKPRVKK